MAIGGDWTARFQDPITGNWTDLGRVTDLKITPSPEAARIYGVEILNEGTGCVPDEIRGKREIHATDYPHGSAWAGRTSGSVSVDLTPEEAGQFNQRLREILDREMTQTMVPTTLFGGPRPSRDYARPCLHCQAGLIPGTPGQWDGTPGESSHDCPECEGTGYEARFVRHEGPAMEGCWPPGTGIPRPRPGIEGPPREIGQVNVEGAIMRIVADDSIEPGVVHFFDAYDYRPGGTVTANTVTMKGINWQGIEPMSAAAFDRIFHGLVEKERLQKLKPTQPRPAIEQQVLFEDRNW